MSSSHPGHPAARSVPTAPAPGRLRSRLLVAVAVTAALLAACAGPADSQEETPAADLDVFYDQELSFGSCEGYATTASEEALYVDPFECARLEVPMDYDEPAAERMQIAVLRLPATGPADQRIGSLVTNPGGPGGSGLSGAVNAGAALAETPVVQRFDLVGFDPRGVGASTPAIDCFSDEERDAGEDQTTLLATAGRWSGTDTERLAQQCAERSGGADVLASVGTRDAARDTDVLRAALGDRQLTFSGQSYGTRLGAVYAEMFPQNVRAMVLDGAVDPTSPNPERRLTQQAGFQRSFEQLATVCAEDAQCPLGTEPERATEVFQDLVHPLIDAPVPAGDGRTVGFNQATGGVTAGLYYAEVWPAIIAGLTELKDEQRGDTLLAVADQFGGRDTEGVWANYLEANLAINCNDEERRTPEQETELRAEIEQVSPYTATGEDVTDVTRDACESWPGEPSLGIPYAQDVRGLPDVLVITVTGDPATPVQAGQVLADSLASEALLTVEGERHTVALDGVSPCVNEVYAAYLIDLAIPAADERCTL